MEKTCAKCEIPLSIDKFTKNKQKKDGLNIYCKQCSNDKCSKYRNLNKAILPIKRKTHYENNKEKIKKVSKQYRKDNPEWVKQSNKNFYKENPEYYKNYIKKRRLIDPIYKLKGNIRVLVYHSFKNKGFSKLGKSFKIIGCAPKKLKQHLESKFESWMNWDNYGLYNGELNYGWDIDHIIPLSSAKNTDDVIRLNHYTNLQPLCSYTNRIIKRNIIKTH